MRAVVLAAVVALLVGGGIGYALGSRSSDDGAPAQPQATSAAEDEAPAKEAATPPPAEAGPATAVLGDEVDLTGIKVTAFEYRKNIQDLDGSKPDDGSRWDAALVKVCNVTLTEDEGRDLIANFDVWGLSDNDDGRFGELDLTPSPAPELQWQSFKKLGAGQCAKGWVALDVPQDADPTAIVYTFNGEDQASWSVR